MPVNCIAKATSSTSAFGHIYMPIDMRIANDLYLLFHDKAVLVVHVTSCGLIIAGPMLSYLYNSTN